MDMLEEVDIADPPLAPFDIGVDGDGEQDDGEDDEMDEGEEDGNEGEGVVEVEANGTKKKRRANNYTEIEDATLC